MATMCSERVSGPSGPSGRSPGRATPSRMSSTSLPAPPKPPPTSGGKNPDLLRLKAEGPLRGRSCPGAGSGSRARSSACRLRIRRPSRGASIGRASRRGLRWSERRRCRTGEKLRVGILGGDPQAGVGSGGLEQQHLIGLGLADIGHDEARLVVDVDHLGGIDRRLARTRRARRRRSRRRSARCRRRWAGGTCSRGTWSIGGEGWAVRRSRSAVNTCTPGSAAGLVGVDVGDPAVGHVGAHERQRRARPGRAGHRHNAPVRGESVGPRGGESSVRFRWPWVPFRRGLMLRRDCYHGWVGASQCARAAVATSARGHMGR